MALGPAVYSEADHAQTRERRAGMKEERSRLLELQAFIPSENTQRKYACYDATAAVIELKLVRAAVRDENTRHKQHKMGKCREQ